MVTRKHFGYTASIQKGTNRLITSSQANWGSLSEGSFVIFDDDEDFYKIVAKESFFYIKDFERVENDKIFIHENIGLKLSLNDSVKLTFKEYETKSISVLKGGKGFKEGETLNVGGGKLKKELEGDLEIPSQIRIVKVDKNGKILKAELSSRGAYNTPPDSIQVFGEAELSIELQLSDKRIIEDRCISNLLYSDKGTVVVLNHPLPPNVKDGKLSTNKWELILNTPYVKENKINATYKILTEFTPNLNLPLLRDDISKSEVILNQALMTIDKEIKELKDSINKTI